jgi:hypothetical protein
VCGILVDHGGLVALVETRNKSSRAGSFWIPLRDLAYFQRFFIEGCTVAWPNGADIAPETLYEHAKASAAA